MGLSRNSISLPEKEIKDMLVGIVKELYAAGDFENLTVKNVREISEHRLDLATGTFKLDPTWKGRSKEIIVDATNQMIDQSKRGAKRSASVVEVDNVENEANKKHKRESGSSGLSDADTPVRSVEAHSPLESLSEAESVNQESSNEHELPESPVKKQKAKPAAKRGKKKTVEVTTLEDDSSTALSTPLDYESPKSGASSVKDEQPDTKPSTNQADRSESELSSVIDQTNPKPSSNSRTKKRGSGVGRTPKNCDNNLDPEEAELKKLQNWLLKCGVRKVWSRVLGRFDTHKEKVAYLKGELNDVGMTGRFSQEKARQIKERRELADEVDAAISFNRTFGKTGRLGRETGGAAKVLADIGFDLGSGEETD